MRKCKFFFPPPYPFGRIGRIQGLCRFLSWFCKSFLGKKRLILVHPLLASDHKEAIEKNSSSIWTHFQKKSKIKNLSSHLKNFCDRSRMQIIFLSFLCNGRSFFSPPFQRLWEKNNLCMNRFVPLFREGIAIKKLVQNKMHPTYSQHKVANLGWSSKLVMTFRKYAFSCWSQMYWSNLRHVKESRRNRESPSNKHCYREPPLQRK
jgi:hypothetical protein